MKATIRSFFLPFFVLFVNTSARSAPGPFAPRVSKRRKFSLPIREGTEVDYARVLRSSRMGEIVVAGQTQRTRGDWDFAVARLNADDSLVMVR